MFVAFYLEKQNKYHRLWKTSWVAKGRETMFFIPWGILEQYKPACYGFLRKKFGQADNYAQSLFNSYSYNRDTLINNEIEIQNDIIQTIREEEELESQCTNSSLLYEVLNDKIATLRQEKDRANRFDDLISNDSDQTMNNANKLN